MKVAIRKQRKKIKAKMLGTPEEAESRYVPASIPTEPGHLLSLLPQTVPVTPI